MFVTLVPLLAIPYYVKLLGPHQWGVISFLLLLQSLATVFEGGFSQAAITEFSRRASAPSQAGSLLKGLEIVYGTAGLLAIAAMMAIAPWLASSWLHLNSSLTGPATWALTLAGFLIASQLGSSLFRSALLGLGSYRELNSASIVFIVLRHISTIILLVYVPSVLAYTVCQTVFVSAELLWRRRTVSRIVSPMGCSAAWPEMLMSFKFVATMSLTVWMGALAINLDKILLSKTVPVALYGVYSIASTVGIGLTQLMSPVVSTYLPRLSAPAPTFDGLIRSLYTIVAASALILVVGFYTCGRPVLNIWLGDLETANQVYSILQVFIVGTALNYIYTAPYLVGLGARRVRIPFVINGVSLAFAAIFLPMLIARYGIAAAASPWVVINMLGLLAYAGGYLITSRTRQTRR